MIQELQGKELKVKKLELNGMTIAMIDGWNPNTPLEDTLYTKLSVESLCIGKEEIKNKISEIEKAYTSNMGFFTAMKNLKRLLKNDNQ